MNSPNGNETALPAKWQAAWRELGVPSSDDTVYQQLVDRYGEPHRKYHTMQHLSECFTHFETLRSVAQYPAEIAVALWFHDVIYDPRESDNEERSAEWARACAQAAGVSEESAGRIHDLVMATKHDAIPVGRDAEVIVDVDLAILGAPETRFDEYEEQVREEYAWVPEETFGAGRWKVLQQFAGRESIYQTECFRDSRERQARENIARSLAWLEGR